MATSTEMVTDRIPEHICIRKLLSIDNGSEFHVSIPKRWVSGLGLGTYLKLTKNENNIVVESLSI